jgi:Phosphotransferase enzyme family
MKSLTKLIQGAIRQWFGESAVVDTINVLPQTAQDSSSGIVRFYRVSYHTFTAAATIQLITKESLVYERQILSLLNAQSHPTVPLSYALDMETREPQLLCQQDAGIRKPLSHNQLAIVAQALATIHFVNKGSPYLPWMRRLTNETFFHWWKSVWNKARTNTEFLHEFGHFIQPIEQSAQRVARCIDEFWTQSTSLTVLHTDLTPWHVLLRDNQPFIIDWDQARYGPFYLDLVTLFTLETVPLYYRAAIQQGSHLPYDEFLEHFHAVRAFPSLKYMIPPLSAWLETKEEESYRELQELLPRASSHSTL